METNIEVGIDSSGAKKGAKEVNRNLDTLKRNAALTVAGFKRVGGAIKSALSNRAVLAATAALGAAMFKIAADTRKFGAAISDLSAITGATGADLEFYSDAAKEFGRTTTLSATEVATAFKLVASAKPDLLESKEALAAVTKEAITLAEAAGTGVADAASTLGNALNQFGADADQASRFINVLAAGAKFGASEIADTAVALRDSGTVAAAAGISFEQLNATIQSLSTVGIKGAKAGTALRAIFARLQKQTDQNLNPAIVGLDDALKNLGERNLDVTQLTKLFGDEHFVVAQAMIKSSKEIKTLTGNLTGTKTAYEQAAIKVDNFDGSLKQLNSAIEGVSLMFGATFVPALRSATDAFTGFLNSFSDAERTAKLFRENIAPNTELLARFGLSLDKVDEGNLERVTATIRAMTLRGIDLKKQAPFEAIRREITALGAQSVVLQAQMKGVSGESEGQKIAYAILANELAKLEGNTQKAVDAFIALENITGKKKAPKKPKSAEDASEGTAALQAQVDLIQSLRTEAEIFNDEIAALNARWNAGQVDVDSYERKIAELFGTFEDSTAVKELNDAQKEWIATNDDVLAAYEASRDGAQIYADEVARLTTLFEAGLSEEAYISRLVAAQETLLDSTKETAEEWSAIWDDAGERFSQGVGDSVANAVFEQEDLGEAAKKLVKDIAKQAVSGLIEIAVRRALGFSAGQAQLSAITTSQVASSQAIAAASEAAASNVSLSTSGANALPAQAGIASTHALTSSLSNIVARATGGSVEAGKPVLVGERGEAEIFTPGQSGRITPMGKMGGGVTNVAKFEFNITAFDSTDVDTIILERMPLFKDMVASFYEESGQTSPV